MNSMNDWFSLFFSIMAFIIANIAIILVLAQRWSTHKIEWKPLQIHDPLVESDDEAEAKDEEDSKILEEALSLQRKAKKKDIDPLEDILETNNF